MAKKKNDISDRILREIARKDYRPQRTGGLARSIGVGEGDYSAFRQAVKDLMRAGRVVYGGGNCIMMSEAKETVVGTFRGHARGFGFVVPDAPGEHGDLFIPPGKTLEAITGDKVVARVTGYRPQRDTGRGVEGQIVEIIERGQSRFVGELIKEGRHWVMKPDGHSLHAPVLLGDVTASRARKGDQVVVEITEFPSLDRPARGVIVEVLGKRGDPEIDTISIIRQYHFRDEFTEDVLDDARRTIKEYDLKGELSRRDDLQDEIVVTIDPDDAKDYDDAISIRPMVSGGCELGVHIADVSTLVKPGSTLDDEASQRGNSIYFPRYVIPMLPEVLSNGLCSLQEDEPRLTKSVFIQYDAKGNRKGKRFANSVIYSNKRLTYGQATEILAGKTAEFAPEIVSLIKRMDKLAKRIQKRRLSAGMVVLDLPEVELVLDDDNDQVIDVEPADTSFSHTIIEMFMVEANEAVAELFTSLDIPHIRRIHPDPPADAQQKLTQFLRILGQSVPRQMDRDTMIRLLAGVRGKPESFAVNLAVLRSMSQAEYSPQMVGHFALASSHYTHFTSPIRRYPDLIVHRLLDMYLQGKLKTRRDRASVPSKDTLVEIGRRCSYTERRAEAAERELKQIKILRLLETHLGDIEEGVVTGVTNVGVFVQLRRYLIDGLIRFRDLPDDWWDINPQGGFIMGQQSGQRIVIGDVLQVQIASVDIAARELDLVLPADALSQRSKTTRRKTSQRGGGKPKKRSTGSAARRGKTVKRSRGRRPRRR